MNELSHTRRYGYEDLLQELASIERSIRKDHSGLAMNLMVLEAKFRDRFQALEWRLLEADPTFAGSLNPRLEPSAEAWKDLLPQELPPFPTFEQFEEETSRQRNVKTLAMAALLAVVTAFGVFGVASAIHMALSLLA